MTSNLSYSGPPTSDWIDITKQLVEAHPVLGSEELLPWICQAWQAVWATTVGCADLSLPFVDLSPRAQIVGDFFESILAYLLSQVGPWRRGTSKEKDLVYTGADFTSGELDFEIKTSGQATGKIYGNRSYAQPGSDGTIDSAARKQRSGYYLCICISQNKMVGLFYI